jgi:hypothetical protein
MRKFSRAILSALVLFSAPAWADGFRLVSKETGKAEYEGNVTVTGRFERRQDAETLDWRGDRVCFFADAASQASLPGNNGRVNGFCFSNHSAAAQLLKLSAMPTSGSCGAQGTATVSISRYVAEMTAKGREIFDQAQLDRVLTQGPTTPLRCN